MWRYTKAGKDMMRPDSQEGIFISGPLTVEDWKVIVEGILEEMIEQAKREAKEEGM
jgi:hypothetical protein